MSDTIDILDMDAHERFLENECEVPHILAVIIANMGPSQYRLGLIPRKCPKPIIRTAAENMLRRMRERS